MHVKEESGQWLMASGETNHSPLATNHYVRVSVEELESRAAVRRPGYVEAFKAAAKLEADGRHLLITQEALRRLWAQYTAPGLGDEVWNGGGCCGG
jgi:hypothetical protein